MFYISRLNDPTTYFFHWLCKRYGLTLHSEPTDCPICLDRVTNCIELSCGAYTAAVTCPSPKTRA